MFDKIRNFPVWFSRLTDKKKHLEFITAILSIPVLLSVIFLNYSSIKNQSKNTDNKEISPPIITIIQEKDKDEKDPSPSPSEQCKADIGPVTIESPEEDESLSDNPLSIIVEQNDPEDEYCAVIWSYRINGGSWSNFDDKDISIYNVPSGEKKLEVRVKSVISGKEKTLTRNFTYKNNSDVPTPTPTTIPTNTPTPSPTIITTPTATIES